MATSTEIITRALRKLTVLRAGGTASAEMLNDALAEMNDMMDGYAAKGVNISPSTPLPAQHRPALISMLAMRLAQLYGITASPGLASEAADGWLSLQAAYIVAPNASFDTTLRCLPSQRCVGISLSSATPSSASSVSGFCTLTAGSPTTTVTNGSCLASSTVTLTPYSETAQAEWNTAQPTVAEAAGSFTITHANNQILDRVFEYLIVI